MENAEKDDFKLEGQILFKIENFSEFARSPSGTRRLLSDVVVVRGLPWRILVINGQGQSIYDGLPRQLISYFLQCNAPNPGLIIAA